MLYDLQNALAQTLSSAGFSVSTSPSISAKDKTSVVLIGPDVLEIASDGIAPGRRPRKLRRMVTLLFWAPSQEELDAKAKAVLEAILGMELTNKWNINVTAEPFYEPETRLYGVQLEVRAEAVIVL